ncbi:MAG TPA: L-threonylcarbamoyladenylate synthase [Candidatus Gastranaerophilaceae bacterium]|nr:L-threonylcarbamoyladenylate synthase [Candidatus Gastranaerophilaceae bacterium]
MAYLSNQLKQKIKNTLDNDGVIAFVTDTVWGLGCLPSSKKAVKKIYEIKKREAKKPLILMSNSVENLLLYVKSLSKKANELAEKYFPGALTLVLKKSGKTPDFITSGFDTVGIRIPDNKVFQEICECIEGKVLATTSANLSSEPSAKTYKQALEKVGNTADLVIEDFGQLAKGLESTVALILENEVRVLRQGAVKFDI